MNYNIIYILTGCLCLTLSCTNIHENNLSDCKNEQVRKSLIANCESLCAKQNVPKLKEMAVRLQKTDSRTDTRILSEIYQASAFFNAAQYEKAHQKINQIKQLPGWQAYHYGQLRTDFLTARCYQYQKEFDKAIGIFKQLVESQPRTIQTDSIEITRDLITESLLQLMYCRIMGGKRDEGVAYFDQLQQKKDLWIVKNCSRDISICSAYAHYEASFQEKAVLMVEKAFDTEEKRTPEKLYVDYGIGSVIYNQNGNLDKAIEYSEKAIEIGKSLENKSGLAYVSNNLAHQYLETGQIEKSIATFQELLQMKESKSDLMQLCVTELNLYILYTECGLHEEANEHFDKAVEYQKNSSERDCKLRVMIHVVEQLLYRQDWNGAASKLHEMKILIDENKETNSFFHYFYETFNNILLLNSKINEKEGITLIRQLTESASHLTKDYHSCYRYILIGSTLVAHRYYDEAISLYLSLCSYIEKRNLTNQKCTIYKALSELYLKTGQYQKACYYFQLYDKANTQRTKFQTSQQIAQFKVKFETLEKEKENLTLKNDLNSKREQINRTLLITGLLILLLGFLLNKNRLSNAKRELAVMRSLKLEIDILNFTNSIKQLHSRNKKLENQLENSAQSNFSIENELPDKLITTADENLFISIFKKRYPCFFSNLKTNIPSVSKNEQILCALIFIHQSNYDIAKFMGITYDSVIKARYRLRKKLQLEKEDSLEDTIRSFSAGHRQD